MSCTREYISKEKSVVFRSHIFAVVLLFSEYRTVVSEVLNKQSSCGIQSKASDSDCLQQHIYVYIIYISETNVGGLASKTFVERRKR